LPCSQSIQGIKVLSCGKHLFDQENEKEVCFTSQEMESSEESDDRQHLWNLNRNHPRRNSCEPIQCGSLSEQTMPFVQL